MAGLIPDPRDRGSWWDSRGTRPRAPRDRRYTSARRFGAACPARRDVGAALVLPEVNDEDLPEVGGAQPRHTVRPNTPTPSHRWGADQPIRRISLPRCPPAAR